MSDSNGALSITYVKEFDQLNDTNRNTAIQKAINEFRTQHGNTPIYPIVYWRNANSSENAHQYREDAINANGTTIPSAEWHSLRA